MDRRVREEDTFRGERLEGVEDGLESSQDNPVWQDYVLPDERQSFLTLPQIASAGKADGERASGQAGYGKASKQLHRAAGHMGGLLRHEVAEVKARPRSCNGGSGARADDVGKAAGGVPASAAATSLGRVCNCLVFSVPS